MQHREESGTRRPLRSRVKHERREAAETVEQRDGTCRLDTDSIQSKQANKI